MKKEIGRMFKTEMVLAILNSQKVQTRRLDGLDKVNENPDKYAFWGFEKDGRLIFRDYVNLELMQTAETARLVPQANPPMPTFLMLKPRYRVGDIIYVKETYRYDDFAPEQIIYRADMPGRALEETKGIVKWKSSMFMPKIASRIRLEITEVRVQRLQDITEEDAEAEGVNFSYADPTSDRDDIYRERFHELWDKINGKKSPWAKNDWLYAVTFKRI